MKQMIMKILHERNIEFKNYDILYNAGINMIINNIEFYFDKPYTCESVLKELFKRGVIDEIRKSQSDI